MIIINANYFIIGNTEFKAEFEKEIEIILDFSDENKLIGIEIIGLGYMLEIKNVNVFLTSIKNYVYRVNYDEDADAVYIKINKSRSSDQLAVSGRIGVFKSGAISYITTNW